jgi:hypothetical protein
VGEGEIGFDDRKSARVGVTGRDGTREGKARPMSGAFGGPISTKVKDTRTIANRSPTVQALSRLRVLLNDSRARERRHEHREDINKWPRFGDHSRDVVQRQVLWKRGNHPNTLLDPFTIALNASVQEGARRALLEVDALAGGDGYTDLWKDSAALVIALRDNTLDEDDMDEALVARRFAPARYGYAVEAYANAQVGALQAALPLGYTFQLQGSRGMTRPDFIVFNDDAEEAGWFDITSEGSRGHIDLKTGSGWRSREYVAEIIYPALDTTALSLGNSSIGIRVRARNIARRRRREWQDFVSDRRHWFAVRYDLYLSKPEFSRATTNSADNRNLTKAALHTALHLDRNVKVTDTMAKDVLRAFGLRIQDYGFSSGGAKSAGEMLLREVQDNY